MKTVKEKSSGNRISVGSALILTVVLTSLLAVIGVLFVMVARVDKMATSAISENRELNFAVETVVAKISQELASDVPRTDANGIVLAEYYDYPDISDIWLANLEPYESEKDGNYYWRQISDLYYTLDSNALDLQAEVVPDYQDPGILAEGLQADADGDGVADSRWVIIPDMQSNKGKPIYAAIRIIDNGAMLNINTAYKFDPCDPDVDNIDGSSQTQINLFALSKRGTDNTIEQLDDARFGFEPHNPNNYIRDVVWRYGDPDGAYTPFDIGDELKLRNRYILNYNLMKSRIEELWSNVYDVGPRTPIPAAAYPFSRWPDCTILGTTEPNDYDYRHISTFHNMDRIIDPDGDKMFNVNAIPDAQLLYEKLRNSIDTSGALAAQLAQLAANIKDYSDDDSDVTVVTRMDGFGDTHYHYGFEAQPFISEIGIIISEDPVNHPEENHFAVELYNPFNVDIPLGDFNIVLVSGETEVRLSLDGEINANSRYVVVNHADKFPGVHNRVDERLVLADSYTEDPPEYDCSNFDILLERQVGGRPIYVDRQNTDKQWFTKSGKEKYLERDDDAGHILYQNVADMNDSDSLGIDNSYTVAVPLGWKFNLLPFNESKFVCVGDVARLLIIGPSEDIYGTVGMQLTNANVNYEGSVRVNLHHPTFSKIFQYLTVLDPADYGHPANETRIKGRINVNTAPWFVIAQLPWISPRINEPLNYGLAHAIVAYRDKLPLSELDGEGEGLADYSDRTSAIGSPIPLREDFGFASIGELATVVNGEELLGNYRYYSMSYYMDGIDQQGFPDLTTNSSTGVDGAVDDFEERDLIFSRISNLVTVRSDVFTAYILVRIGADGPQKRVVAILDRSKVTSPTHKVRVIALHPVPDPR